MSSSTAQAAVGDIIDGRYRIDAWLGQGNMAIVFRATHLGTSQECALKLILPHIVERPDVRELFLKEARVGGRIGRNPHIVDVIDAGFDEKRKVPFMAMELLEGEALDRYVKNHGAASPALVRTIFLQVADALEQAHAKGVVHRDLKPANLFLTFDRKKQAHIKVVDFGIAKLIEGDVQRTATQIGTPAYAAPEQLGTKMRELAAKQNVIISPTIGPTTDVWSLGLIAYELLIGSTPGHLWNTDRREDLFDLLMGIVLEATPKASVRAGDKAHLLPRGFDSWLERCLRKNAVVRWPSVKEAVAELVVLLDEGYEDEATRQMDAARAHTLLLGRPSQPSEPPRQSVLPPEDAPPKNATTLPLGTVAAKPDKPEKSDKPSEKAQPAGPRGTAMMDVMRDAEGRPIALSLPESQEGVDESDHQPRALPFVKPGRATLPLAPPSRPSSPQAARPPMHPGVRNIPAVSALQQRAGMIEDPQTVSTKLKKKTKWQGIGLVVAVFIGVLFLMGLIVMLFVRK